MDKKQFDNHDLPRTEIMEAIYKGMNEGREIRRKNKRKTRTKLSAWVTGTAASVVLASGFVISPVNTVLAEVPLIGKLYEQLNFEIGKEIAASNLVTEINQKATSNGVDVTVTSAFYDGNIIGVTIKAVGKDLSLKDMDKEHSPESGYAIGGSDKEQLAGSRGKLEKLKDGSYAAGLEFEMRDGKLPKNYTLPLTFTQMANKEGTWKFDIPVTQLPVRTVKLDERVSTEDLAHTIEMKSLTIGKATATLEYTSVHPVDGINEGINMKVLDDQGRIVSERSHSFANVTENQTSIIKQNVLQLGKINQDTNYLMVYPEVDRKAIDITEPLNQKVPFEAASLHSDFKIIVKKIVKKDNRLMIDYEIVNVKRSKVKEGWYKQFAEGIHLIRTSNIIKSDDEQSQYNVLISPGSLITTNTSKKLDQEKISFQTTFNLDSVENMNINDYSLKLPFGVLSKEERIKLSPIQLTIK
ncbi:DUF4179 domain-containing protein [Fictibacillus barbaricus]|uniref:DUF4179 domain-containing protein n=1 Tax=Fictibacillus barbaricus TaxID=182136 RepID=A0ABU1U4L0_9BACL|nr:DUF4179 domain-containing protein [Fictibacillus barbaricus]MDR7074419.1 hypothetical protein [Fictibacillus barbaricus]